MLKKYLGKFTISFGIGVLVALMFISKAEATFNPMVTICHKPSNPDQTLTVSLAALGGHLGHGDSLGACPVTPTPTVAPTATPTPEVEPTPTPYEECQECEPTPTREPEPTSAPQPLTNAEPGPAPKCSEPAPVVQPKNFGCYRNGAVANCEWIPGDESVVDIFYSEGKVTTAPTSWPHSKTVLYWEQQVNGKTQIGGLVPGLDYTFALRSRNACSGGQFVYHVVVDSDTQGMYFPLSYWYLGN